MAATELTDVQARTLLAVAVGVAIDRPRTAREIARDVWPDDEGWDRWTAGRGATHFNGCKGGTMPLRAGRVLRGLEDRGLVRRDYRNDRRWNITEAGRALVEVGP